MSYSEAGTRLARLNLPPDGRARMILQVAACMAQPGFAGGSQLLGVLVTPLVQAEPAPREVLLLLYEHLGWVSADQ